MLALSHSPFFIFHHHRCVVLVSQSFLLADGEQFVRKNFSIAHAGHGKCGKLAAERETLSFQGFGVIYFYFHSQHI